ncbi:unnamed protein product, partial [Timema podura]|nr:unnamed protein product [Timema podura]
NEKHVSLKVDAGGEDKTINVAIFGIGRAGSIHLSNLAHNPRAEVLYIVDDEEGKSENFKRYWRLDKVTFLKSSEANKVFNDPKSKTAKDYLDTNYLFHTLESAALLPTNELRNAIYQPVITDHIAQSLADEKINNCQPNTASKVCEGCIGMGSSLDCHCNYQVTVKSRRVDAVVVASPTYTHKDIVRKSLEKRKAVFCEKPVAEDIASTKRCYEEAEKVGKPLFSAFNRKSLEKGKAVFCEKPVAEDIASTKRCYEEAEKVGKPLFSAFNRRFDPAYSELRDRARKGEVGHIQTIKVCSRDSPLPPINYLKHSGGIYHDCAVHDIDIMCWVLGEYPTQVAAIAHTHTPEIAALKDHDTVAIVLKFPSGTTGMIDLSRNSCYGYDQRLEVFGPRGMITCDNERPMTGIESQLKLSGSNYNPIYFSFASRYKLAYYYEMEHFLDFVQGKTSQLKVEGKEVLAVSKIATACEESARTGQFITLKWAPGELPSSIKI